MVKVVVQSRSGRSLGEYSLPDSASVDDLQKQFHQKNPKYYADRQRFTIGDSRNALAPGKAIASYNLKDGEKLVFKDLGPQVGWATVFFCEYFGPLLLYPLLYPKPSVVYGASAANAPLHFVQTLAVFAFCGHYLKRILETIFIHKFSHNSMPIFNLFKNSAYYWGFAVAISYFTNHPLYTPPSQNQQYVGLALFLIGETGNFICHIILSNLRPPGTRERRIPRGFLFSYVSCPNYTFEVLAWIGFSVMTQSAFAVLFTIAGFAQMYVWAVGKHKRYIKEFDGKEGRPSYPRGRKAIVPFLL